MELRHIISTRISRPLPPHTPPGRSLATSNDMLTTAHTHTKQICVLMYMCLYAYLSPLAIYVGVYTCIHTHTKFLLVTLMHWHSQASDFRIQMRQVAFLWWDQHSNPGVCGTHCPVDWMPAHKLTEPTRMKVKIWTQQPVLILREHSAHLTALPMVCPYCSLFCVRNEMTTSQHQCDTVI